MDIRFIMIALRPRLIDPSSRLDIFPREAYAPTDSTKLLFWLKDFFSKAGKFAPQPAAPADIMHVCTAIARYTAYLIEKSSNGKLSRLEAFEQFLIKVIGTHITKSEMYSHSDQDPWQNFRATSNLIAFNGVKLRPSMSVVLRATDKYQRLLKLLSSPVEATSAPVGDTLMDTLLDLYSYLIIYYILASEEAETRIELVNSSENYTLIRRYLASGMSNDDQMKLVNDALLSVARAATNPTEAGINECSW